MATYNAPVGITPGRLLPVTGAFALPFTAYFAYLSMRCVNLRVRDKHWIGDDSSSAKGSSTSTPGPAPSSGKADPGAKKDGDGGGAAPYNELQVATRAHANFAENVPLAFVLAAVAELNGANRRVVAGLLGSLLALRVLHADFGVLRPGSMARGRPVGYFGTLGVLGGLAGYGAWLVKGYWGL